MKTLLISIIFMFIAVTCYAGEYKTMDVVVYNRDTGKTERVEVTVYVPSEPKEIDVLPPSLVIDLGPIIYVDKVTGKVVLGQGDD